MKPRIIESCPSKEWNELIEEHMNSNGEKIANLADRISKLEKECKYVYTRKNGEDDYKFFAVWEKDKVYDVSDDTCDLIAIPFTGAYADTLRVTHLDQVSNVPGTSDDHPSYGGSWMGVLELLYAIKQEDYAKPFVQTLFSKNNELSSHRFCLQSVCYQTCFVNFIRSFVAQPLMNPFTIEELYKFPETFSQFLCA